MNTPILLPYVKSKHGDTKPGTWFLSPVGMLDGKLFGQRDACSVNIVCPSCGKSATLRNPLTDSDGSAWPLRADGTQGHHIASNGAVSPSVVCPHTPCPWHVYVTLGDWATAQIPVYDG